MHRHRDRLGQDSLGRDRLGRDRLAGFTLTEMLVVLGIILVVVTMIAAGAVAARKAARQTLCLTQLRSIGQAVTNYAIRYDGTLPFGSWADVGPAAGMPTESPLSRRGFGTLAGDPASLIGVGAGPLPTIRDALQAFMNTKEKVWRCPLQRDATGAVLLAFQGSGYADDDRGFRPGYRFMSTLEMRAYVRTSDAAARKVGEGLRAGDLLVRNIGGVKQNRLKTLGNAGMSQIVIAYDGSPTYHSKGTEEFHEIPPGGRLPMRINLLYLDGHAQEQPFSTRDEFLALFHPPVLQKGYGADLESEFKEYFVHPARKESNP